MKQCECGRNTGGSQLCLVLYDRKSAEEKRRKAAGAEAAGQANTTETAQDVPEVLGAIEAVRCEKCLARGAWKSIGVNLLFVVVGVVVITVIAGLFSRSLRITWIGGGLIILGMCGNLIKSIFGATGKERMNGAARHALDAYKKLGCIPATDFIWLTEQGSMLLQNGRIPLTKQAALDPDEVLIASVFTVEESLRKLPENEAKEIRIALMEARRYASPDVLTEPPHIRKAFFAPLAGSFLIGLTALITLMLFLNNGLGRDRPFVALMLGAMAVSGIIGAVLLVWKKRGVFYLFTLAAIAFHWVAELSSIKAHGGSSPIGSVIVTVILLLPALLWLPYVIGRD
ncbi:MAG: hypothetical protein IJP92_11125 [Lachnospiraceae bacterium]|nr:hypothetical protein [Lachnospiraceae bacterium]